MCGFGEYKYITGCIYKGNWDNNMHHGYGEYFFNNGSSYKGEWVNHKMHGEGTFIDINGKKWIGEFANGTYQSKLQKKLKLEKLLNNRIEALKTKINNFLSTFEEKLLSNDKKILKEIEVLNFGINKEEIKGLYKDTLKKFQDYKPEQWLAMITFLKDPSYDTNILRKKADAQIIDHNNISNYEFGSNGQIVEIIKKDNERNAYLILILYNDEWYITNYFDSKDVKKK